MTSLEWSCAVHQFTDIQQIYYQDIFQSSKLGPGRLGKCMDSSKSTQFHNNYNIRNSENWKFDIPPVMSFLWNQIRHTQKAAYQLTLPWCCNSNLEAEVEWHTCCRQHFQTHFLFENVCILIEISLKFNVFWFKFLLHWSPRAQLPISTGSDNGLGPKRCQAIIWTNHSLMCWYLYASPHWVYTLRLEQNRWDFTDLVLCLFKFHWNLFPKV